MYTSPVAFALLIPQSTSESPSTENGYSFPLKLSFPSPQLTPMPAAMEVLWMVTFAEGVAFSAAATVARWRHH